MTKAIFIILMIATCVAFIGSISILTNDNGQNLDLEGIFLSTVNGGVAVLCVAAAILFIRWLNQVIISFQIIPRFFFYSWRNAVYDGAARRFSLLLST